jgi:SAM-dependent methyltransferase
MMRLAVIIAVLLLLAPHPACADGFRRGGGFHAAGTARQRGTASTVKPDFGTSRRAFSDQRIVIPHLPGVRFHYHQRPFMRFRVVPGALSHRIYRPFIYYYPYRYGHFTEYFPYGGSSVIIQVPAGSGPMVTTSIMPELPAGHFAPAPLLGGSPARSLPEQLAPFDPTPQEVVDRMLALAAVRSDDVIYDLGSGDGRMLLAAAKKYGIKGVGFEVDPGLVKLAREKIKDENLEQLVDIRQQDFMTADLSPASVVMLYLSQDGNAALKPHLQRQLRPGARIVSYTFDMGDWPPKIVESYRDAAGNAHILYFWEIAHPGVYGEMPQ